MNSNRMKYASTPTYGMQKRNFAKKAAAAQDTPTPDFTQQPALDMNAPISPFTAQNPFASQPNLFAGMGQPQAAPFYQAPGQLPQSSPGQPVFGMPSMPYGAPMTNGVGFGSNNGGYFAPMPPQTNPAMNPTPFQGGLTGFMPQGYPQSGATPPTVMRSEPIPAQAMPAMGMPGANGMYGGTYTGIGFQGGNMGGAQQPGFATAPYPMMGAQSAGNAFGRPAFGGMENGLHATPTPRPPIDLDKWLKIFLFGILPFIFIPCLFVASAFDFLRYAFIALAVVGLSVVWYRQSFTSAMRMTVTIGYLIMSIVVIAMLINGNRDVTRQSNNLNAGINAQSSEAPTATPEAAPLAAMDTAAPNEDPGESEAELRLTTFMDYWRNNQIENMVNLVQPSWATLQDNPASALFTVISNRTPGEYTIEGVSGTSADSSRTVTMSAFIDKNNGKEAVKYRFMILMVREGGEWYVDPNSLATNDVATETPSPAPGKEVVSQSLQPRMTVTPIPDPGTKLYYNASGGKYYHADPNCSAVNEKFLPMASFLYSELDNAPYSALQPCLKCGAPTQSLGTLAAEESGATPTPAP
ncbi:MAG: hypothetical protein VB087_03020 [Candidatus Limiplasma sp.]|nr:hypothetical protein [Candidatus Limiplasma sp.]MEA5145449.1 hypothetical protein [Candidatus Limiplasma sp.]